MKANGNPLLLSDVVRVGVYRFEGYKILDNAQHKAVIVGYAHEQRAFEDNVPIKPTAVITVSDRLILDSLLILASKVFSVVKEKSDKLILKWCETYGLPFCSIEASQHTGYLACPIDKFRDFLFILRDTFWKCESLHEDILFEPGVGNSASFNRNPYKKYGQALTFTEGKKQALIAEFINTANFRLCFEYSDGKPTLYNYADDIISLIRYQLALILLSDGESIPRRCKCCGSMFFARRKNQLYGPCCTRQKRYAAEKRKKGKGSTPTKK